MKQAIINAVQRGELSELAVDVGDRSREGLLDVATDLAPSGGHLPDQDASLAASALVGALLEGLIGPLAPDGMDDPARSRQAVQASPL